MKRIILEGTEEQFRNLQRLYNESYSDLPKSRSEYCVDTVWSIADVTKKYNATDEEAMEVLSAAMENAATMDQMWFAIDFHAEEIGLTKIENK